MCLGIPGKIVRTRDDSDLAEVEVAGVVRDINLALLDPPFVPGEYILIHSGFALERMSEEQASNAMSFFGPGGDL